MASKIKRVLVPNLLFVSDLHCGCRMGLYPVGKKLMLRGGVGYLPSRTQEAMHGWWREMLDKWLPVVCRDEPFGVVVNGDAVDGRHHGTTTHISAVASDQATIAYELLAPLVERAEGRFWMVGGTEAHTGVWQEQEEQLAERLGAIPDEEGARARPVLYKHIGRKGERLKSCGLIAAMHHIGTTGSMHYESSGPMKEIVNEFVEAGRWEQQPPDALVRAHRHRHIEVMLTTRRGKCLCVTLPGWQAKTPFAYKIAGARQSQPQFGGVLMRHGDEEKVYSREFVRSLERPKAE